ncbi:hypothetical protein PR048_030588 [Dryococelus australis]|uniref:Uncharacterized protein n=1 Tax=Dryococelus australis TaxID=614101 RepID=A0ABQ9GC26_9NEOP|nr:hypothetical protein PR048_030588 [Dryococelus australis]
MEGKLKMAGKFIKTLNKLEGNVDILVTDKSPLFHTVFDTSWRRLAQSSPSTETADNQCTVNIGKFVHKTVDSSLQRFGRGLVERGEEREIPEKTRRTTASPGTITAWRISQGRPRRDSNPLHHRGPAIEYCHYSPSHLGKPGSIPGGVTPAYPHVGIVPYDAVGQRVFSVTSRFPPPLHSGGPSGLIYALSSGPIKSYYCRRQLNRKVHCTQAQRLARKGAGTLVVRVTVARIDVVPKREGTLPSSGVRETRRCPLVREHLLVRAGQMLRGARWKGGGAETRKRTMLRARIVVAMATGLDRRARAQGLWEPSPHARHIGISPGSFWISRDSAQLSEGPFCNPRMRKKTDFNCITPFRASMQHGMSLAALRHNIQPTATGPFRVTGFSHVKIVRRTMPLIGGFSRGSPVSHPTFTPGLLHSHLTSPSSVLKTSMFRITEISSLAYLAFRS